MDVFNEELWGNILCCLVKNFNFYMGIEINVIVVYEFGNVSY